QTCILEFSAWSYLKHEVILTPGEAYLNPSQLADDPIWEILPSKLTTKEKEGASFLQLELNLKRKNTFHIIYIIIPLILFAVLNKCVFLMPTEEERTGVAVTLFLSFIVYMSIVNENVPASSNPMSYMYFYLLYLLLYSTAIVMLVIFSLKLYKNASADPAIPVPYALRILTSCSVVILRPATSIIIGMWNRHEAILIEVLVTMVTTTSKQTLERAECEGEGWTLVPADTHMQPRK
ncbi:MAG: hypothetical protein AB2693_01120, partial [Candidatus Thiodiazotropha sp.]